LHRQHTTRTKAGRDLVAIWDKGARWELGGAQKIKKDVGLTAGTANKNDARLKKGGT